MCEKAIPDLYLYYDQDQERLGPMYIFDYVTERVSIVLSAPDAPLVPLWRQDQLQEILGGYMESVLAKECFSIALMPNGHPVQTIESWEQLWLSIVMKEKFSKVWTGTDWQLI
jgi:hypothetical protein